SKVEQRIAKAAADPTKPPRNKHGFRGLPLAPLPFDLAQLAPTALLTEFETAQATRLSISTLASWRKKSRERDRPPLPWLVVARRRIRYEARAVREFIGSGQRPRRGRPRKKVAPAKHTKTAVQDAPVQRSAARAGGEGWEP